MIDLGGNLGIVSQPGRPSYAEIAAFTPQEQADFEVVLANLDALASDTRAILVDLEGVTLIARFAQEARDGAEVDALRAELAHAVFGAALAHGRGQDRRHSWRWPKRAWVGRGG